MLITKLLKIIFYHIRGQ